MNTILLSIKPEYVENILKGSKKYEYRKRLASQKISAIIIYSTWPESKIVGEVQVCGTISASPFELWKKTKKNAGISREKYKEYFNGTKTAHAYILGNIVKYDTPKDITEYGLAHAPQSFAYFYC